MINIKTEYSLKFLSEYLDAKLIGNANTIIKGIAPIDSANESQLSFIHNPKYIKHLKETRAGAVLLNEKHIDSFATNYIVVEDPYLAYARLTNLFVVKKTEATISDRAVIGKNCKISNLNVDIAPNVVIGDNVTIEDNVVINASVVIGNNAYIKSGTVLNSNVSIYNNVQIGCNCIIHSGVVIGADGFGFAKRKDGSWSKIHQLGTVRIGDDVEIGANTTIDCGALNDTIIADGVKLDNQIQIGHNVEIGKNTIMAGCSAVAGSTKIGANCAIGGFSVIAGHISICDNSMITGGSGVASSINEPGVYSSGASGVVPNSIWRKNVVRYKSLDQMFKRLKKLETQMEKFTTTDNKELENVL